MSSTTAQMLSEIGTGTAAELLMGVRYNTSPPGPTFIPQLDEILLEARYHAGGSSLRRGDLVEIVGPSGSGKTTLATFLLMTTLLPPHISVPLDFPYHPSPALDVALGGRGMRAALVVPPTHRSIVPVLVRTMRAHIEGCIAAAFASSSIKHWGPDRPAVGAAIEEAIRAALQRLYTLQPRARAMEWTAALRRLLVLAEEGEGADVVVCDGFSDGFWPERWAEEERGERKRAAVRGPEDATLRDVWEVVTALRRDTGAVVVLAVHGLRPLPNKPFYKPHLPPPYPSPFVPSDMPDTPWPLNIQITLPGRSRALQFPAEILLADALRARPQRPDMQVLDAIVRVPGGKGPAGTSEGARYSFGVTKQGLVPFAHKSSNGS